MNGSNLGLRRKLDGVRRLIETSTRTLRTRVLNTEHIHFLHVGKTGGTALVHAFRSFPPSGNRIFTIHGHGTTLKDIPEGEKVIFVLRNPHTRFVSGFNSRLREGKPRYTAPWTPDEKKAFEQFSYPNDLAEAIRSDSKDTQAAAEHAMHNISHVSESYSKWFSSVDYLRERENDIEYIGFQETLDDDFQRLKKALGLPEEATLPTDDIKAHKSPDGLPTQLSPEACKNLRDWFAEDFEFIRLARALMESRQH